MKYSFLLFLIIVFLSTTVFAQEKNYKEMALEEFKLEHYDAAIQLLDTALTKSPDDAEIYYYLGFFNHYRAYDSRPLNGYDYNYSKNIFGYLEKAIELNPDYGDAKYFYGAECSANAFISMQNKDLNSLKHFYKLAFDKGAYPDWLIEFGKNMLNSCDENAILFTGGNADFDICSYLQLHQNFRTDISVIPIGNIDRPWYVKYMRDGLEGGFVKVNIGLTDYQIMDIHPFKWDTTTVEINIPEHLKSEFKTGKDYRLKWEIVPDLSSDRMHSKIEGEKAKMRTYLSPQRAILLHIIENNYSERPVFFSVLANNFFYGGLDEYFQNCGLVYRLVPVKTTETDYGINAEKLQKLLQSNNFKYFNTINSDLIPRISGCVYSYYAAVMNLMAYYKSTGNEKEKTKLIEFYKNNISIGFDPEYEIQVLNALQNDD